MRRSRRRGGRWQVRQKGSEEGVEREDRLESVVWRRRWFNIIEEAREVVYVGPRR